VGDSESVIASIAERPKPTPPNKPEPLFQERGVRRSRAIPYELHVHGRLVSNTRRVTLTFVNSGRLGAVFHVYDRLHLGRVPRRYTVEAGKSLADEWHLPVDDAKYDLWVYGPNGFLREFRGTLASGPRFQPEIVLEYDGIERAIRIVATNGGPRDVLLALRYNAYHVGAPRTMRIAAGRQGVHELSLIDSHHWYDVTLVGPCFERRFAGRLETSKPGFSDPAV